MKLNWDRLRMPSEAMLKMNNNVYFESYRMCAGSCAGNVGSLKEVVWTKWLLYIQDIDCVKPRKNALRSAHRLVVYQLRQIVTLIILTMERLVLCVCLVWLLVKHYPVAFRVIVVQCSELLVFSIFFLPKVVSYFSTQPWSSRVLCSLVFQPVVWSSNETNYSGNSMTVLVGGLWRAGKPTRLWLEGWVALDYMPVCLFIIWQWRLKLKFTTKQ